MWGPPLTSNSLKHTVDRRIPHSGEKIGSSASISLHNQDPNELQKRGRVEAKGESRAYSRVVQEVEANTQCFTFHDVLKRVEGHFNPRKFCKNYNLAF